MKFICTHTDFKAPTGDYTIVSNKPFNNKYNLPVVVADNLLKPLEYSYAEGYMIYDIWNKYNEDWIAINHYRRYLLKGNNETTLAKPLYQNMHWQYKECHNINDLLKVESIIDKYFPEYSLDYKEINKIYPCNMFILNKEDFNNYCNFVFSVLQRFSEENNLFTDEDVKKYVESNKQYYKKFDLSYQSRLHGFLMERIGTIFFLNYLKNKPFNTIEITITNEKITY